jgi:NADH pyrophosphatase NudC (nudix superfamily)
MRQHRGSPISPLLQGFDQLAKGMLIISHNLVLQACKLAGVRKAVAALIEQRSRKRRYIQTEETLTVGDVQDLITEKDSGSKEAARQPAKRVRKERHCGRCGKTGHNARTCAAEIVDLDESEASE